MILIVALCIIGLLVVLMIAYTVSKAVHRHRHDITAPGINEAGLVSINGIAQYVQIRGKNPQNPVLLMLHGGPGSPLTAMTHCFQYAWEDDFTVVQWDQRQAGKTYFANDKQAVAATLNFDTVLEDAWQVTQYLQKRFGVKKIALMGHSWGTVLGTALVQAHPEAFSCYIGVGQVTELQANERMGFERIVKLAQTAGNQADIAELDTLKDYPGTVFSDEFCAQMMKVRKFQQKYGVAEAISLKNVLLVMSSPYYSIREGLYYAKNTTVYQRPLFRYMFEEYDVRKLGTNYQVPVYYIMGENDYQTPVPLAQAFFNEIIAPKKAFFLVPGAGHFTMADSPYEFNQALLNEIRPTLQE